MHRRLILVVAGALFLAACSSSGSSSTVQPVPSGGGGTGSSAVALTASDFAFSPTSLTAAAGTVTVTVTNDGSVPHSFTLDDGSVSKEIAPGTSETVTLNLTGSVAFHCHFHPTQMTGTITVGGAEVTPQSPAASTTGTTPRY